MPHEPLQRVRATRHAPDGCSEREELLADETPVALVYNGRSHAVMMATAADLDDFAYGFTLAEGIVEHAGQIELVDRLHTAHGISLQMLIPQACSAALAERERGLVGRTGCGLCGTSNLAAAVRPVRRVEARPVPSRRVLREAFEALPRAQPLNDRTGGLHAAAALVADGALVVREDVGRHNAVDKVLGACARRGLAIEALLVTSRASYEVLHKAAQANVATVAAISAPTALAVRTAVAAGQTLIGFARDGRFTVYADAGVRDLNP